MSRAPRPWVKAMVLVKHLETQRGRTLGVDDRHVEKAVTETRETLPRMANAVESEPISSKGEVASCGEGGGGGCSTCEARTTQPCGGKVPCFVNVMEELRVSECSEIC